MSRNSQEQKRGDYAWLKGLISELRDAHRQRSLTAARISEAVENLEHHRFGYDDVKFPPLRNTKSMLNEISEGPRTLAEALLWKLGKWPAYKNFVEFHRGDGTKPTDPQSVVFAAFALHLKDETNPIFDQHSLRALWAICAFARSSAEFQACKAFLVDAKGKWKAAGSGKESVECYHLFTKHLVRVQEQTRVSLREIDRLLMPLGRAIKEIATYRQFCELCR